MSIKIYYGLRFKIEDINKSIDFIHDRMYKKILSTLEAYVEPATDSLRVEKFREFMGFIGEDFESGFNLWVHSDGYCYVALVAQHNFCEAVMRRLPPYIENYSYYDSVDRPDRISEKKWNARGEVWESVCLEGSRDNRTTHNIRRLYHSVFDWKCSEHSLYLLTGLGLCGRVSTDW